MLKALKCLFTGHDYAYYDKGRIRYCGKCDKCQMSPDPSFLDFINYPEKNVINLMDSMMDDAKMMSSDDDTLLKLYEDIIISQIEEMPPKLMRRSKYYGEYLKIKKEQVNKKAT